MSNTLQDYIIQISVFFLHTHSLSHSIFLSSLPPPSLFTDEAEGSQRPDTTTSTSGGASSSAAPTAVNPHHSEPVSVFIAKYTYNPAEMSPNSNYEQVCPLIAPSYCSVAVLDEGNAQQQFDQWDLVTGYMSGLHTEGGRTGISPLQLEFPPPPPESGQSTT